MKKFLVIAALMVATLTGCKEVHAATSAQNIESIDVSKLTPEQKATLLAQANQLQEQAKSTTNLSATVRDEATAWAQLGGNMGRAAVAAAKELGVAANEFIQTPLGKVTMALVIYKVMGDDILGVLVGGVVLTFFLGLSVYFLRREKYSDVEYEHVPVLFGLYQKRVVKTARVDSDLVVGHFIAAGISAVIGLLIGINTMM